MRFNWLKFGYKKEGPNHMTYHSHPDFEIFYFHEGRTRLIIQHRIYELQPGDIVLLNGLAMHRVNSIPSYPNIRTTIEFLPEFILPILKLMNAAELLDLFQTLNNSIIRLEDRSQLKHFEHCMLRLNDLLNKLSISTQINDALHESHVKNIIIEMLFEILDLTQSKLSEITMDKSDNELLVERMLSWIMDHHTEKLSMKRLAEEFFISKRHISHLFKHIVGMTVMEYIMNCRIDHAKFMLSMKPNKKISDIALDVGFTCNAHFSRSFRTKVGTSPSGFRNQSF